MIAYKKEKKKLLKFEVHICDHCNLNCKGCDHFSPLAEKKFTDIITFEKDLKRIAELFGDRVARIHLLGGEPLLAPNLADYIKIARSIFPNYKNTVITILTNGILLKDQDEEFWTACKECKIKILITQYPIKLDYQKIIQEIQAHDVDGAFFNDITKEKKLYQVKISQAVGEEAAGRRFLNCEDANKCIMLKEGKLYTCTLIPNIEHFNRYFKTSYFPCEKDFIDIYKASSADEILEFLSSPPSFCKYCERDGNEILEWEVSKKERSEWA